MALMADGTAAKRDMLIFTDCPIMGSIMKGRHSTGEGNKDKQDIVSSLRPGKYGGYI